MTDPLSTAALGVATGAVSAAAGETAKTTANLLNRILGPLADEVGQDLLSKYRDANVRRVLLKADRRIGRSSSSDFIKPRIAAAAFETAQYADDDIVAEYVSGVLASSRAPDGGTDEGVPFAAIVGRLSSLQIRLHYILYSSARSVIAPQGEHLWDATKKSVLLPLDDLIEALGLSDAEDGGARLEDAVDGLSREGLIGEGFYWGSNAFQEQHKNDGQRAFFAGEGKRHKLTVAFDPVFSCAISTYGARLYVWGLGLGGKGVDVYMDETVKTELVDPSNCPVTIERVALEEEAWTTTEVEREPKPNIADLGGVGGAST